MKIAIVTGAASGIGAQVARSLAAEGIFVAMGDINSPAAEAVLQEIEAKGGQGLVMPLDVTSAEQVAGFVDSVVRGVGSPRIAVACAGVASTGTVPETSLAAFDRMIDVNLRGTFLFAKHVLPQLETTKGSFTAIASDAGLLGSQGFGAYCASKHGVVGLVKAMAMDHGPHGVRCNAVCPGYVDTPMLDQLAADLGFDKAEAALGVPLSRFATPQDVANLVLFLSSDAGSYMNGAMLPLDGGGSAGPYVPA